MQKMLAIAVLLLMSVFVTVGCENRSAPVDSGTINSSSDAPAPTISRINPNDLYVTITEAQSLLEKVLNGRKINDLSDDERFNAELLSFMLSDNSSDYYASDRFSATDAKFYKIGEKASFDLNSDGKNETISVTYFGEDSNENMELKINNESIKYFSINPLEQFAIVHIDSSDSNYEIVIGEDGSSGDPASFIFSYSNGKIINCVGEQGFPKSIECNILPTTTGINIDGSGYIEAFKRSDILQTWSFMVQYRLENCRLTQLIPKHGYYTTDYPVFMLKPLTCYKDMDVNSESTVIEDGQTVRITATDNKEWVRIALADETIVWAHLAQNYDEIHNGDKIDKTTDVFYGLAFYD